MNDSITILLNKDKSLRVTKSRTIYQKENKADRIKFLIDKDFYENIENCIIMLQATLPNIDTKNINTIGKMRLMTLEPELYKEQYYMLLLPITTVLTENCGDISMWLLFTNMTDEENVAIIKTDSTQITIQPSKIESSVEIEEDKTYDVLTQIQQEITKIQEDKMDKSFKYDEENSTIQFFSKGIPIGNPIKLDDEISWKNWN